MGVSTNAKLIVGAARKHGTGNTETGSNLETKRQRSKGRKKAIIFLVFLPGRNTKQSHFILGGLGSSQCQVLLREMENREGRKAHKKWPLLGYT